MKRPKPKHQIKAMQIKANELEISTSNPTALKWVLEEAYNLGRADYPYYGYEADRIIAVEKGITQFTLIINECFDLMEIEAYINGMDGKLPELEY